jgi:hypothetical protein
MPGPGEDMILSSVGQEQERKRGGICEVDLGWAGTLDSHSGTREVLLR